MAVQTLNYPADRSVAAAESSGTTASVTGHAARRLVIRPRTGMVSWNPRELWEYRDLLWLLSWRDISSRYRQSLLGWAWAVIRPVLSVVVFAFVFGKVAGLPSEGVPYAVFNFAGLVPWMYFSGCLSTTTSSVVSGGHLLTKVYFPRLILPLSSVIVGLVDFAIHFGLLLLLLAACGISPGGKILLIPVLAGVCAMTALSVGLWLTALNVKYRDIGHAVPFLIQLWMYLTPVVYSGTMVPEKLRLLYGLNPMVGIVESFRWAMLNTTSPDWAMMSVSGVAVCVLLGSGLLYFHCVERQFADII